MKLKPEELRDLYTRGTSVRGGEHPAADALARLLEGSLSAEERESAVAHVAVCSRCAEDVRVAGPVRDALNRADHPIVRPAVWWRPALLLLAAASLFLVAGLAMRLREPRAATDVPYRAAGTQGLRSLLPEGAPLRRDAAVLIWAGAPPGTTFYVLLANERLDVLARLPGTRGTEATVPASVLAGLPHGAKLVWRVTAVQPDGTRTNSRSFVVVLD